MQNNIIDKKINHENYMCLKFQSKLENELFARSAVTGFVMSRNPTISWINELKTAISEAITNAVIHGYQKETNQMVELEAMIKKESIEIKVQDNGIGIDSEKLKNQEERAGIGMQVIKTFVDEFRIESNVGKGTALYMVKNFESHGAK